MRNDERTKAYVAKRRADGKSVKETLRCLKRYISNEVYRALLNPRDVPEQKGPALRELRTSLGFTQRNVAFLLGVNQACVSNMELGRKRDRELETRYEELLGKLSDRVGPAASSGLAKRRAAEKGLDRQ